MYIKNVSAEERAANLEAGRIARQAKIEAAKDLKTEYADENHWRELAKKYGTRMPVWYLPASESKYLKRVCKTLNVDIDSYIVTTGCRTVKEWCSLNPKWTIMAYVGLFLEWYHEMYSANVLKT